MARWRDWFLPAQETRKNLDILLSSTPAPDTPLFRRLEWLKDVFHWVLSETPLSHGPELDFTSGHPQALRVKWCLHVLQRNPEWKLAVGKVLGSIAIETRIFDLLVMAGLHQQSGLVPEFFDRLLTRFLPKPPDDHNLELFFSSTFRREQDAMSLARIDVATFQGVIELFAGHGPSGFQTWKHDIAKAVVHLSLNIAALGSLPALRQRIGHHGSSTTDASAFFKLHTTALDWHKDQGTEGEHLHAVIHLCHECLVSLDNVYRHMDENGVSIAVVYQLERMRALVQRLRNLLRLYENDEFSPTRVQVLLASVVFESVHSRSLRALIDDNTALIAKKIVENSAETGEHYIAKNRSELRHLFQSALGGGVLTAATTIFKYLISALPGSPFVLGFIASLNYSLGFIAIQLKGFSLATKQPAMTAATLAEELRTEPSLDGTTASHARITADDPMVTEMLHVVRSQALAVIGNVLAVIPGVFVLCGLYAVIVGQAFLHHDKAEKVVASFSLLGPTPFYAAWTGVLLFSSSLFAGWFYHWVLFRRLPQALARSRFMTRWLGADRARKFSLFFKKNSAGFAANVSLGFLLGLSPVLAEFLGLPLDVRHVTLSTGSLTAAAMSLGSPLFSEPRFWFAVVGIASMAVLNLTVAFLLALAVAMRAKRVPLRQSLALVRTMLLHVARRPGLLFWPPK